MVLKIRLILILRLASKYATLIPTIGYGAISMSDCIFCKIVAQKIPAKLVHEDADFIAFEDIRPKAKVHVLVVPKKHIESLAHQQPEDLHLLGKLTQLLPVVAKKCGLHNGFRTVVNTGPGGGQEVAHLHYHILGGPTLPGL